MSTGHGELESEDSRDAGALDDQQRSRRGLLAVRDLSYDQTRTRQALDLMKASLFDLDFDEVGEDEAVPQERLKLYVKRRPRGPGYVADFVFTSRALPVRVYGILVTRGQGLEVAELEVFTLSWRDMYDLDGVLPADDDPDIEEVVGPAGGDLYPSPTITSDLLRQIPLGRIIGKAQRKLAMTDWRDDGVTVLGLTGATDTPADDLHHDDTGALEAAATAAALKRSGRPPLSDDLLEEVARACLREGVKGPGLTRRLASIFDRPEATISDWIAAARHRQFLTPATAGRRGAGPGARLAPEGADQG